MSPTSVTALLAPPDVRAPPMQRCWRFAGFLACPAPDHEIATAQHSAAKKARY
jgi:hypothetical protein